MQYAVCINNLHFPDSAPSLVVPLPLGGVEHGSRVVTAVEVVLWTSRLARGDALVAPALGLGIGEMAREGPQKPSVFMPEPVVAGGPLVQV